MSALGLTDVQQAARVMREESVTRDKSYRRFPLGQEWGSFLRAKRIEGCSPNTIKSYETTGRLFTLFFADVEGLDYFTSPRGADLIVDFLVDHWENAAEATLDNRIGAVKSFFSWAEDTGRIVKAPRIKRRRGGTEKVREAHALAEIRYIVSCQESIEDEVALLLMGRLGFRKMDVGNFQARDVDLAHDLVYVRSGKGGTPAEIPVAFDELREALSLWLTTTTSPDQYLWHPRGHRTQAPNEATVHRKFKRCLERAGVPDFPMHELRHSAGDRLWRETGDLLAANQLLRHKSLEHTKRYLHPTSEDLRSRMVASDEEEEK